MGQISDREYELSVSRRLQTWLMTFVAFTLTSVALAGCVLVNHNETKPTPPAQMGCTCSDCCCRDCHCPTNCCRSCECRRDECPCCPQP